jgi:hypothetical protein
MNRRSFLGAAAAALSLATAPAWIRKAFAGIPSSKSMVFDAYRRARRAHRPLLIFVIPADPAACWPRGQALGAFLTHGSDAQLAPLASCEVVCATAAHIHDLVPKAPAGEPLALLVDTRAVPATVHVIAVQLDDPLAARSNVRDAGSWEDANRRAGEVVEQNIERIAVALRDALGPADPKLAAKVRARLSEHEVPGSRWAIAGGCGMTFEHPTKEEEENEVGVACGMGFVPEKSRRFLFLLAQADTP